MTSKAQILAREKKLTLIAGIASVMGVAIILATFGDSAAAVRASSGLAEELTRIEGDLTTLWLASIGQFIGWALLGVPLVFLFKAAAARAPQVRPGLIGVMVIAPLLLGIGSLLSAGSVQQAAKDFSNVDQAAITKCVEDKAKDSENSTEESAEATDGDGDSVLTECRDDEASDIRSSTSLAPIETGIGLAGLLGFTIAVIYVSLWSMRTGLISRFWGSLGIALGAVFAFFTLFTLVWFIYVGLLLAGWVPGGKPPAWASGEAQPWPKPGQRPSDDGVIEGTADEIDASSSELEPGEADEFPDSPGEMRKRKKRN